MWLCFHYDSFLPLASVAPQSYRSIGINILTKQLTLATLQTIGTKYISFNFTHSCDKYKASLSIFQILFEKFIEIFYLCTKTIEKYVPTTK